MKTDSCVGRTHDKINHSLVTNWKEIHPSLKGEAGERKVEGGECCFEGGGWGTESSAGSPPKLWQYWVRKVCDYLYFVQILSLLFSEMRIRATGPPPPSCWIPWRVHPKLYQRTLEFKGWDFLAALAALYLTLVSDWVSQTDCHYRISTKRVTFETWDPSDIWFEWCLDKKTKKDRKTDRQKGKKTKRQKDKKSKSQKVKKSKYKNVKKSKGQKRQNRQNKTNKIEISPIMCYFNQIDLSTLKYLIRPTQIKYLIKLSTMRYLDRPAIIQYLIIL